MYGNAILRLTMKDGSIVNIFRYTFAVNALCFLDGGQELHRYIIGAV